MFGHDHVSNDDELIATVHLLQRGQKQAHAVGCRARAGGDNNYR